MGNPSHSSSRRRGSFTIPWNIETLKCPFILKMHFGKHCTWWGFMDIIGEFKKREKRRRIRRKKIPFLDLNGMVSFGPWLMKDGKNRTGEGKNEYNHLLLKNTSIYFLLAEIDSLICCVFVLYQRGSWLCQFFGEIAAIFLLRKSFLYNVGAFMVSENVSTLLEDTCCYDEVLMKLKAHLLRKRDTTHK